MVIWLAGSIMVIGVASSLYSWRQNRWPEFLAIASTFVWLDLLLIANYLDVSGVVRSVLLVLAAGSVIMTFVLRWYRPRKADWQPPSHETW